jgi:hypothetical protein
LIEYKAQNTKTKKVKTWRDRGDGGGSKGGKDRGRGVGGRGKGDEVKG